MAINAPGQHFRKGLSLIQLFKMFPDDEAAEKWFIYCRWPDGIACTRCGSVNVNSKSAHKTMPFRCRDCDKFFSPKTDTIMSGSNLGYQIWAVAFYLMSTSLKGVSSMKLHRDLSITQKSAWYLGHRIRCAYESECKPFGGAIEIDETFVGGTEKNKHAKKKLHERWRESKVAVIGAKERDTKRVVARVIDQSDEKTLHQFVEHIAKKKKGTRVYTDGAKEYRGIPYPHEWVNHSRGEYVRGDCTTNGIESFWSGIKRGHKGTYHKMSRKHLPRYIQEFVGRQNVRHKDTIDQMHDLVAGAEGKRMTYHELVRES